MLVPRFALPALLLTLLVGCTTPLRHSKPLRVSDVSDEGDAARRASTRLVVEGLDSDAAAQPTLAVSQYERAIQIDPTNPYVYLAMARHHVDDAPQLSLSYLDQAAILFQAIPDLSPRVEAHLIGLRGAALVVLNREGDAAPLLARAGDLAPSVWHDARLSADELK